MNARRRSARRLLGSGLAFVCPWLIGLVTLTVYPFCATFAWSLCRYDLLSRPRWIGLENYRRIGQELLSGGEFAQALGNTGYYAAVAIPGSVLLGIAVAVLLHPPFPGRSIARTLVFLPSVVPTVATAIVWMWLLDPRRGLVNRLLRPLGTQPNWFNSSESMFNPVAWENGVSAGAKDGLVLMSLWGIGQMMVIYLAGLSNVRRELYEAAELDGAGGWMRFRVVTWPHLTPVVFYNLMTGLVAAGQYFTQAYVVSGGTGGPDGSTRVAGLHVFLWSFKYADAGYASACAWVLFLIVISLTALLFGTARWWVHHE